MSSGDSSPRHLERRKKSRRDVDAGEGGSRNAPPRRSTKATVHRDFPRGRMDIDTEIEEEEEDHVTSSDDDVEDETYQVTPRAARRTAYEGSEDEDDDDIDDELRRQVEEEEMEERNPNAQIRPKVPFHATPTIRVPHKALGYAATSYKGKTQMVMEERVKDPRQVQKSAADYRFHTTFQQDFYETVIITKERPVSESQWVDWNHMANQNDPIFDQVIAACERTHIKRLMGFKFDWNKEIIAQFYATLYIEEEGNIGECIG